MHRFEAITLVDWDLALETGSIGTHSGLLGDRVADVRGCATRAGVVATTPANWLQSLS